MPKRPPPSPIGPDRPIRTAAELQPEVGPCSVEPSLVEAREFLKLVKARYGHSVLRRTLQLYSSPGLKLLPLPIHRGGHKSYYLHPEHTERMGVVLTLRERHFLPLQVIARLLKSFPPQHYGLIHFGILNASDLADLPRFFRGGFGIRDVIFRKTCEALECIEDPMARGQAKYGPSGFEKALRFRDQELLKETKKLAGWIRSGRREEMTTADFSSEDAETERDMFAQELRRKRGRRG